MQIFKSNSYVIGVEYRDDEGFPRDGSIIIEDDSPKAKKILEGYAFELNGKTLTVLDTKRDESHADIRVQKRIERLKKLTKAKPQDLTAEDVRRGLIDLTRHLFTDTDE